MLSSRRREMGTIQNNGSGWFIDYGIDDEAPAPDLLWDSSQVVDYAAGASLIAGFDPLPKEGNCKESSCSKKRNRTESCAEPGTKACREKMRRDRLNDKFSELCSILEPGKPPKSDKVAILIDATHRLSQLRLEAKMLLESNRSLQESIKKLKEEKIELREEKSRLKVEKERAEETMKGLRAPSPFVSYPTAAGGAYHPALFPSLSKTSPYPNYPPVAMWQWLPPAVLDTSQDHVLRPPVA